MTSNLRFMVRSIPVLALLVASGCKMFSGSSAPAAGPVFGSQIAEIHGGVRAMGASQQWRTLRAGDALMPGDVVQTALDSAADIVVGGGNRVLLQSDSVVVLEALPAAGADELHLRLRSGWLTLTSPANVAGTHCEIGFPKGLAGSRGATFNIHADGRVRVTIGTVVVKLLDDLPPYIVTAGTQFDPRTGAIDPVPVGAAMESPVVAPAPAPNAPTAPHHPLPPNDPFSRPMRPK